MSVATSLNLPLAPEPVTQNDIIRVLGEYTFIRLDNGDEAFITTASGSPAQTRNAASLPYQGWRRAWRARDVSLCGPSNCLSRMIKSGAGKTW